MTSTRFNALIRECIREVLLEIKAKRICAWCQKDMGWTDTSTGHASHGICPECAEKVKANLAQMKAGKADSPQSST